jgi:hypothetical protein
MSDPNARDLRGELEDFTGEYPRSWIAKVGDVVVGRVERYSEGSTPYGRCPSVVVADEITGELMSIWLMHTVLRNGLRTCRTSRSTAPRPTSSRRRRRACDRPAARRRRLRTTEASRSEGGDEEHTESNAAPAHRPPAASRPRRPSFPRRGRALGWTWRLQNRAFLSLDLVATFWRPSRFADFPVRGCGPSFANDGGTSWVDVLAQSAARRSGESASLEGGSVLSR